MRLAGRVLQGVLHERSFIPPGRRAHHGYPPPGAQRDARRRTSRLRGIEECSNNRTRIGRLDTVVVAHSRRACGRRPPRPDDSAELFLDNNRDDSLREVIDRVIRIGSCGISKRNLLNGDHRISVKPSHCILEGFNSGDLIGVIEVNGDRCSLSVNCHCRR